MGLRTQMQSTVHELCKDRENPVYRHTRHHETQMQSTVHELCKNRENPVYRHTSRTPRALTRTTVQKGQHVSDSVTTCAHSACESVHIWVHARATQRAPRALQTHRSPINRVTTGSNAKNHRDRPPTSSKVWTPHLPALLE